MTAKPPYFSTHCCACNLSYSDTVVESKEHFWPKWLLKKGHTSNSIFHTVVGLSGNHIIPSTKCFPLCTHCNTLLGSFLEQRFGLVYEKLNEPLAGADFDIIARWLLKYYYYAYALRNKPKEAFLNKLIHPLKVVDGERLYLLISRYEPPARKVAPKLYLPHPKRPAFFSGCVLSNVTFFLLDHKQLSYLHSEQLKHFMVVDFQHIQGCSMLVPESMIMHKEAISCGNSIHLTLSENS